MTNPASFSTRACAVIQRSAFRFFGFLRLPDGRFGQRIEGAVESLWALVCFEFARLVDELLALRSRVGLFDFGFRHGLSLADLAACHEVRHG